MRWQSVCLFLIASATSSLAEDRIQVGDSSKRACRYWSEVETQKQKAAPDREFSEDLYRASRYIFCLSREGSAAEGLTKISALVPEAMTYDCSRKAKARGDDYALYSYGFLIDCVYESLANVPEANLPRGSATIYSAGGVGRRYWTIEDCQQARKDGEVCSIH